MVTNIPINREFFLRNLGVPDSQLVIPRPCVSMHKFDRALMVLPSEQIVADIPEASPDGKISAGTVRYGKTPLSSLMKRV